MDVWTDEDVESNKHGHFSKQCDNLLMGETCAFYGNNPSEQSQKENYRVDDTVPMWGRSDESNIKGWSQNVGLQWRVPHIGSESRVTPISVEI